MVARGQRPSLRSEGRELWRWWWWRRKKKASYYGFKRAALKLESGIHEVEEQFIEHYDSDLSAYCAQSLHRSKYPSKRVWISVTEACRHGLKMYDIVPFYRSIELCMTKIHLAPDTHFQR